MNKAAEKYRYIYSLQNSGPENVLISFCEDGSIVVNNPNCDNPDNRYSFVDGWWIQEPIEDK